MESLQLLVKKLENVTNLSSLLKSISKAAASKSYVDATVQTSMLGDDVSPQSSSFTSSLATTTIMQTNSYGSILGNFGSARIETNQLTRKSKLRAHSDGDGLSTTDEGPNMQLTSKLSANVSNLVVLASASKLARLRLMNV